MLGNSGKALSGAKLKLIDTRTMLAWARNMTWKGIHPIVEPSRTVYEKGIPLAKEATNLVESRLERNRFLPRWDILIRPHGRYASGTYTRRNHLKETLIK